MTELERALRQQRRVSIFWLCVTLGDLGVCLWTVFAFAPRVAFSPRGAVLVVLSLVFAVWMVWTYLASWKVCRTRPQLRVVVWGISFALTLTLFALSPLMGWLYYAIFGMAFSMFDLPWAVPASLAAYVMIPITVLANGYAPPAAAREIGYWGGFALAYPIYAAMCYVPAMSMRQRIRREVNVAEMERMHRELEVAHQQLAASAAGERELAVLRERARLARDMHDTLGHALVLVSVKLEAARRLRSVDATRADHELDATQQILRDAMSELRSTLAAVRTPLLPDQEIGECLVVAARETGQRAGWQVSCDVDDDLGAIDERTREALLRIGLEALANAERHARAQHVSLALARAEDNTISLQITDDGVGLDVYVAAESDDAHGNDRSSQALAGHYGLRGMRERAAALNGTVRVYSPATGGTTVLARLPLCAETTAPDASAARRAAVPGAKEQLAAHETARRL
jgi:signal transduction histidine kinase